MHECGDSFYFYWKIEVSQSELLLRCLLQQPPLNAQMLAQRQRELYSIQHRQRQLFQQKVMLMRQNMANAPTGAVGGIGTARVPNGPPTTPQQQQQFNFPQGYNPITGKPPTSPSHFSPMTGSPLDNKLSVRVPLSNQTLMSGVQGQFSSTVNSSVQQGLFQQFGGSGESKGPRLIFHMVYIKSKCLFCLTVQRHSKVLCDVVYHFTLL